MRSIRKRTQVLMPVTHPSYNQALTHPYSGQNVCPLLCIHSRHCADVLKLRIAAGLSPIYNDKHGNRIVWV